ncbi:MAG: DHH family phosphoesterase [Candidatus Melainabacteria bacterium]|nr:DHH family phosphoesterase [Candidatus Melainabacteria bacterium]
MLILTHNYPDPDALASAFALKYLLGNFYNIESLIAYGGVIGRMENKTMVDILNIPVNKLTQLDFRNYSNIALVDTQPLFENNSFPSDKKATIVIDQHRSVKKPKADLNIIDTRCGATCVVVAEALLALNIEIPKNVATAIAYGIISETLNLYRGTTKRVISAYLGILPMCDISALAEIQNPPKSGYFFKTLGICLQNAAVCGNVIGSNLGFVENPDLVSLTADFLLTYEGTEWALCTGRYNDTLHLSLRTKAGDANAGEILRKVVGDSTRAGGHGEIAGGSIEIGQDASETKWKESEKKVFQGLIDRLKIKANQCSYPFKLMKK